MKKAVFMLLAVSLVCGLVLAGCDQGTGTKPVTEKKPGAVTPPAGGGTAVTPPKDGGTVPVVAKHPWGSFKVQSFVKTKSVMKMKMAGMDPMETVTEMTSTLVALDSDNATVKMEMVSGGTALPANEIKMPLKAAAVAAAVTPKQLGSGTDTIEVAGKKLNCKWAEVEMEMSGSKTVSKTWTCDEVPGGMVKMVSKTTGSSDTEMTTEVVGFEAK